MTKSLKISGNVELLDGSTSILKEAFSASKNYTQQSNYEISMGTGVTTLLSFGGISSGTAVLFVLKPTYSATGSPSKFVTAKINNSATKINVGDLFVAGGEGNAGIAVAELENPDTVNSVSVEVFMAK